MALNVYANPSIPLQGVVPFLSNGASYTPQVLCTADTASSAALAAGWKVVYTAPANTRAVPLMVTLGVSVAQNLAFAMQGTVQLLNVYLPASQSLSFVFPPFDPALVPFGGNWMSIVLSSAATAYWSLLVGLYPA